MSDKAIVLLQARMSSSRLPGKVLKELNGKPMIHRQLQRIQQSQELDGIVVATSSDSSDDELEIYIKNLGFSVTRGSLDNVYERFANNVLNFPENSIVVRLTGDCPLVMPKIIDHAIQMFRKSDVDYLSNTIIPTYPDGLDVEVFRSGAFLNLANLDLTVAEKEHATLAFHRESLKSKSLNFCSPRDYSKLRWTVDYQEDFDFVTRVYQAFAGREHLFEFEEVLQFLALNPQLDQVLNGTLRNQALKISQEVGSDDTIF
jgi:spore coat polysaccharide biosynthesis protein SpsF (cytidylyltransferase family)